MIADRFYHNGFLIEKVTGEGNTFFRPPNGRKYLSLETAKKSLEPDTEKAPVEKPKGKQTGNPQRPFVSKRTPEPIKDVDLDPEEIDYESEDKENARS